MADTHPLIAAGTVAQRAGVHRTTVHHWAKDGKLPVAATVNGIRLFDPDTVDAFITSRLEAAAS
jgi:excisionase family DNA binding protein